MRLRNLAIGIGGILLGGLLMLWAWVRYRGFFRRRLEIAAPSALEQSPPSEALT